jgi:hypothetical protein
MNHKHHKRGHISHHSYLRYGQGSRDGTDKRSHIFAGLFKRASFVWKTSLFICGFIKLLHKLRVLLALSLCTMGWKYFWGSIPIFKVFRLTVLLQVLKVSRSRNKIVEPQILLKNKRLDFVFLSWTVVSFEIYWPLTCSV